MNSVLGSWDTTHTDWRGGVLLVLAFVTTVVTYPPPATGVTPLFGIGGMFLSVFTTIVAVFIATVGGVLLARGLTDDRTRQLPRVILGILVPVVAVTLISVYLVVVAGFWPRAPIIIFAEVVAAVSGITDAVVG